MISSFELIVSTGLRLTQRLALDARLEKFRFAASKVKSEKRTPTMDRAKKLGCSHVLILSRVPPDD